MPENTDNKRIIPLDIIRTIAILLVVFIHSLDKVITFSAQNITKMSVPAQIFTYGGHICGKLAVPLFFILTGFLVATKTFETGEDIFDFWKKKLPPMYVAYVIWTLVYTAFNFIVMKEKFDLTTLLKQLVFLNIPAKNHLWYIPTAFGLFFSIPFISMIFHKLDRKMLDFLLLVTWIVFDIVAFGNVKAEEPKLYPILDQRMNVAYLGGQYGIYVLFGYLFKEYMLKDLSESAKKRAAAVGICLFTAVSGVTLMTLYQRYLFESGECYIIVYDFPLEIITAGALFVFLFTIFYKVKEGGIFTDIAKASFGIFCVHFIVVDLVYKLAGAKLVSMFGRTSTVVVELFIAFFTSFVFVSIVRRLFPRISHWINL